MMARSRASALFVSCLAAAVTFHSMEGIFYSPEDGYGGGAVVSSSDAPNKRASSKQLDAWINDALKVMKQEGIPGSYEGIHRNTIRESGGNPVICNDWDINAQNGTPSCGLLQVIQPTFDRWKLPQSAYDRAGVKADANNLTDPVANLVTACRYAANRYGSIDNVNGPY